MRRGAQIFAVRCGARAEALPRPPSRLGQRSRLAPGLGALLLPALLLHCGGGGSSVKMTVNLVPPSSDALSPFAGSVGLSKIRVTIEGPVASQYDQAIQEVAVAPGASGSTQVVFPNYPGGRRVVVRAEGFDDAGDLVAFGRASNVDVSSTPLAIPFRRDVAYIIHQPVRGQHRPDNAIYLMDVNSRAFLGKAQIPMGGIARGISAKGGDGVLVAFDAGDKGYLGLLSSDDGHWTSLPLPAAQDLALGVAGSDTVVVAGGGSATIVDLGKQTVIGSGLPVGGNVLDGAISDDGRRAVFIVDQDPGMVIVDLSPQCLASPSAARCLRQIVAVSNPGGVALAGDGHTAYVTSSGSPAVGQVDLTTLAARPLNSAGFAGAVGPAAFSDLMQAVLAVQSGKDGPPHVLGFVVAVKGNCPASDPCDGQMLPFSAATPTFSFPGDIAVDPSGHRMMVVAAGTSTQTAGLTVIETAAGVLPVGSSSTYPVDPDDTFGSGATLGHQRYRPTHLAILYGR